MSIANGTALMRLDVRVHAEESKHSKTRVLTSSRDSPRLSCPAMFGLYKCCSQLTAFAVSPSSLQVGTRVGKREQTQSVPDETLQSGSRRTRWHLWPVKTASIHFIYFIIWVLWTVTWQKGHAMRARRKHSLQSPFIPSSVGVFILRICSETLQRTPGRELGTQPSLLSACTCCGLCRLHTPLT